MSAAPPPPPPPPILRNDGSLDPVMVRLAEFAAAVAGADERRMRESAERLAAADPPPVWVDELLLQSVLMLGYPLALVATALWRQVSGHAAPERDVWAEETLSEWERRGIDTCRTIYGANYARLRQNVRALHPALDRAMVVEGYGRVLSRPGLDLARRELCTVAQVAVLGTPRQLHSHMRGALNTGAGVGAVEAVLRAVEPQLTPETRRVAWETWALARGDARG